MNLSFVLGLMPQQGQRWDPKSMRGTEPLAMINEAPQPYLLSQELGIGPQSPTLALTPRRLSEQDRRTKKTALGYFAFQLSWAMEIIQTKKCLVNPFTFETQGQSYLCNHRGIRYISSPWLWNRPPYQRIGFVVINGYWGKSGEEFLDLSHCFCFLF